MSDEVVDDYVRPGPVTNFPIVHDSSIIGRAELKDDIVTIELRAGYGTALVEQIAMGLVSGMSLNPVYIEAYPTLEIHDITLES